ncbi:YdcF family protein [Thiomicrorhabdus sp. ZW0627]|uniref:YdcF family protein n=1 Tax=Thiomicrorhabdus sp. ZW0627 TaxID=3039774 RepID=UPI002436D0C0|nr:YdcF family protein [Thiomicrorhabdus sp. ZW0627]MDG6774737.1 YdcF family protein [Thiomicrorhabdus sp. ZW0627]
MDSLFFLFSKIAWAFLSPGNLFVIALILGTLYLINNHVRAAKKILVPTALISFFTMAYPVGDFLMNPLESRFSKPESMPKDIDGIIILGGGEDLKRSLSWNVAELGLGGDRYIAAAKLAAQYPKAPVIFTGGSGSVQLQDTKDDEGSIAKQILTTIGIDEKRLVIESSSRNTYENFLYTQPKLPKPDGTYLLVTSAFHMPRSVGIARQLGINVIPYPVDYRSNSSDLRQWDFDLFDHLKALEPAVKEWIGLTVYYWTDKTSEWYPSP